MAESRKITSWGALRIFSSCKHCQAAEEMRKKKYKKKKKNKRIGCSGSLCNSGDSSMVIGTATTSPPVCQKWAATSSCNTSSRSLKAVPDEINGAVSTSSSFNSLASVTTSSSFSSSFSSVSGSFRGMQLSKISGCYECHGVLDPINWVSRDPSMRATVFPCPDCGEIFMRLDALDLHQAVRHAVSELGPEDSSRNIVEIIVQSSWLEKQDPVCKIKRILKVHNSQKTIAKFEDYRDTIKIKANKLAKKYPRCVADGNELLRFYCTTFACSLGLDGATNLCQSIPRCNVCSIIRDGFKRDDFGNISTMATSGRAHDIAQISSDSEKRAMLVCRVIAGRVKKIHDAPEECDSITSSVGTYSNLDDLLVFNPRAILPCFVVIYDVSPQAVYV
ncbi:uncharacterized protein [Typha angustifolia]|uniref:uncharacterized protein n=1 Tax=Typha angustifolia TaxID=59011 RepID=UPI003C2EFAD2